MSTSWFATPSASPPDAPPAYEELTIAHYLGFIGRAYRLGLDETEDRLDFWLEQLWLEQKMDVKIVPVNHGSGRWLDAWAILA